MKHTSERPADAAGGADSRHADPDAMFASHEAGYSKQLKPRHVQMIA
ncbi:MAG: hypothetical protein IOC30_37490, partial [Burkholderia sp.]|nr:hypothetical protein [Burkholderia sp.]